MSETGELRKALIGAVYDVLDKFEREGVFHLLMHQAEEIVDDAIIPKLVDMDCGFRAVKELPEVEQPDDRYDEIQCAYARGESNMREKMLAEGFAGFEPIKVEGIDKVM